MNMKDGDVICFLGDSITANDLYVSEIYQTLRKDAKVKVYNCGVSGATATLANEYLYERCLCFNPTYVVTMFGINDVARTIRSAANRDVPDKEEKIRNSLDRYKTKYHELVEKCVRFGAKVILCVPPPYDEVSEEGLENLRCQDMLDDAADYLSVLADEFHLAIVDYAKVLKPMLGTPGLYADDRVHPMAYGQHVIAQTFLKAIGAIPETDFRTPFVQADWIKKRHKQWETVTYIEFVKYGVLSGYIAHDRWTLEQRKAEISRRLSETVIDNTYIEACYRTYLEKIDFFNEEFAKLIELTI